MQPKKIYLVRLIKMCISLRTSTRQIQVISGRNKLSSYLTLSSKAAEVPDWRPLATAHLQHQRILPLWCGTNQRNGQACPMETDGPCPAASWRYPGSDGNEGILCMSRRVVPRATKSNVGHNPVQGLGEEEHGQIKDCSGPRQPSIYRS